MNELPPELERYTEKVASQPAWLKPRVKHALAMLLLAREQAAVVLRRRVGRKVFLRMLTLHGNLWEIERPDLAPDLDRLCEKRERASSLEPEEDDGLDVYREEG